MDGLQSNRLIVYLYLQASKAESAARLASASNHKSGATDRHGHHSSKLGRDRSKPMYASVLRKNMPDANMFQQGFSFLDKDLFGCWLFILASIHSISTMTKSQVYEVMGKEGKSCGQLISSAV